MERCLITGRAIQNFPDFGNVLRFKRVTPGTEHIQCLTVHKEDSFLGFVNDELRERVEILARVLPDKRTVITFVFDDFCNLCHMYSSRYFYNIICIMLHMVLLKSAFGYN